MSFYPTWRLLTILTVMVLVGLMFALFLPMFWIWPPFFMVLILGLGLIDAVFAPPIVSTKLTLKLPPTIGVGRDYRFPYQLGSNSSIRSKKAQLYFVFKGDILIDDNHHQVPLDKDGFFNGTLTLKAPSRGLVSLSEVFVRWHGFMGLVFVQRRLKRHDELIVTPDLEGVQHDASELFSRDGIYGVRVQNKLHNGSEFHALREYDGSQDPRTIDWRSSARHRKLLSREFQAERNHHIVLAFDTGRLMGEPLAGLKRLDRAIYAGLLVGYCALKIGDNVKSYAFGARPHHNSALISGVKSYESLKRSLSLIMDKAEETNHTLALADMGSVIKRRSLIILFTEFTDDISADLMLESLERLGRKHQILFVSFNDEVVEGLIEAEPRSAQDITRSVFARRLQVLRERIHSQLKRMGIDVLEARSESMAMQVVTTYLALKRLERL